MVFLHPFYVPLPQVDIEYLIHIKHDHTVGWWQQQDSNLCYIFRRDMCYALHYAVIYDGFGVGLPSADM